MNGTCRRRVLMVDDEPNVLSAFRRALGRRFDVVTAESGQTGLLELERNGPFPVVVTDMRMPVMNGLEFLQRARLLCRDSVFIMLTGNADQETAVRAINDGKIFRFLTKPCAQRDLEAALTAGIRQYELMTSERVLLRETLTGSIRIILEALAQSRPAIGAVTTSIRHRVQALAAELGLERDWRIQLAGSLCLLGFLVRPGLKADAWRSNDELESCAESAEQLLRHIPRLESVAAMVRRQREEGLLPAELNMDDPEARVVIGAQILRFVVDLEREIERSGGVQDGMRRIRASAGRYDARLIDAADRAFGGAAATEANDEMVSDRTDSVVFVQQRVDTRALRQGMIVDQDVVTTDSSVLLTRGRELTLVLIERLRGFARAKLIRDELDVLAPVKHSKGSATDDATQRSVNERGWSSARSAEAAESKSR